MRSIWIGALALACVAGAAFAQTFAADGRFTPVWIERPSADDYGQNYPTHALDNGVQGVVHLCCRPRADGRLDCHIGSEWPEDERFGISTLMIAEKYRMTRESVAAFEARGDAYMRLPFQWRLLALPAPKTQAEVDAMGEGVCQAGGTG